MSMKTLVLAAAMAVAFSVPASAQETNGHADHDMSKTTTSSESASTKAFEAVAKKMHGDMAVDYTGNADVDFVRGMIPHHQGAVDMAKVQLEYGKDPEIRKLAEEVIKAQEAEIAMMKEWLKSKGY